MATVGDVVFTFYEKYLKKSTKETKLVSPPSMYMGEIHKETDDESLTPQRRRELAHQSPILMKGIRKKSLDSIRAWFKLETENGTMPITFDEKALKAFEKRTNYKKKMYQAVVDAHIYGDGFLLIQFDEKDTGTPLSAAPKEGSEPVGVIVISPEKITAINYTSDENRAKDLFHFVFDDGAGEKTNIHPDRIQHIIVEPTSHSKLGLSKIDLLRNTIKSKQHVDIAVGRILSWFSHGMLDIKAYDLSPEEAKNIKAVAKKHPSVWMHDPEDFEIDVIQPEAINPAPFMEFLIQNIASALIMPVHVLTGIVVGRVTGAEVGYSDYYRDIKDMQELIYTPLIEDLYRRIIEARGRTWKYTLIWQTVYVDETGEAEIMVKRTEFVTKAIQAGVITIEEGRQMINDGMVEIDPDKKPPKPPQPKIPFQPPEKKVEKKKKEDDGSE